MNKRLLIICAIAVLIFIGGVMLAGGVLGLLYFRGVDLLNNPFSRWLTSAPASAGHPAVGEATGQGLTDRNAYGTENNWIASTIAVEVAGWSWLAVHSDKPVPKFVALATVNPKEGHVHLEISKWDANGMLSSDLNPAFAWDPVGYASLARQLLGSLKATEPSSIPADADFLNDLLTPTGQVLATKDVELSRLLSENPASVNAHERAALLLLSIAARENAGRLSDSRRLLCRAAAHLALADTLRGDAPTSWIGQIADAALRTQAGRELEALKLIDGMTAKADAPPAAQTWLRALRLRNKMDWRSETPDASAPLLLKLAWGQAVAVDLKDSLAASYLDKLGNLEQIPDWGRMLIGNGDYVSVEVGHRFCAPTLGLELKEIADILKAEGISFSSSSSLASVLNDPLVRSVSSNEQGATACHVVGLGLFEDIARRHLMNAAVGIHFWMKDSWGVPDQDADFLGKIRTLFQNMKHEDYFEMLILRTEEAHFPPAGNFHDDLADIPPCLPFAFVWPEPDSHRLATYFAWGSPFSTSYDMENRCVVVYGVSFQPCDPTLHAPTYADLLALNPDSYTDASWSILLKNDHHQNVSATDMRTVLAPFFDYNEGALAFFGRSAATRPDFTDAMQEEVLRKQSALDPDDNFRLADFLREHGKEDAAAEADRLGVARGIDQVLFSNSILPLVKYDFDHGRMEEATDLAKRAADVYSAGGIATYVWLLCKLNRYDEAEDWMKKDQERYGDNELSAFYVEHRDHYPAQFAEVQKQYFPDGVVDVSISDFTAPPKDGCRFTSSSPAFEHSGLQLSDVVVALDSHPVHGMDTYMLVRAMSGEPTMTFIVWRNGKYLEVKASPPGRRFGNSLADYHA